MSATMLAAPDAVIGFWRDAGYDRWFVRDEGFDATLRQRFEPTHFAAARRALEHWLDVPDHALALLILLDQYPRNCFRDSGHAYATDALALHYARLAIDAGHDTVVEPALRVFFYLPFEHSEAMADQRRSVELASALEPGYLDYAIAHRDVIERFGRFPHRNRALARASTAEEQAWLDAGGGF